MDKGFLALLIWLGFCAAIVFYCLIWYWIARIKEKKELAKETIGDKRLKQLYSEICQDRRKIREQFHLILTFKALNKEVSIPVQNEYFIAQHHYLDRIEEYKQTLNEKRYSTIGWEKENFDTIEEIENYVIKNFFK